MDKEISSPRCQYVNHLLYLPLSATYGFVAIFSYSSVDTYETLFQHQARLIITAKQLWHKFAWCNRRRFVLRGRKARCVLHKLPLVVLVCTQHNFSHYVPSVYLSVSCRLSYRCFSVQPKEELSGIRLQTREGSCDLSNERSAERNAFLPCTVQYAPALPYV